MHDDIAAVAGQIVDLPRSAQHHDPPPDNGASGDIQITDVRHGGGAVAYKRSVLEQVGTFNPYIYSDEEPELCIRIRHAGYRVVKINRCSVYHYTDPSEKLSTLIGRWKRTFTWAPARISVSTPGPACCGPMSKSAARLVPGVGLIAGLAALMCSLLFRQPIWFILWVAAVFAAIVAYAIRNRSIYRTVHSLLKRMLILHGTIKGFLLEPMEPDSYPAKVVVIK